MYNETSMHATLFGAMCRCHPTMAWRARKPHILDSEDIDEYHGKFIVGLDTPKGPVVFFYDKDQYWDTFNGIRTYENAPVSLVGLTASDIIMHLEYLNVPGPGTAYFKVRNEFTEACDEYLIDEYADDPDVIEHGLATELFLCHDVTPKMVNGCRTIAVPFRFPGATRGHIRMDMSSCKIVEVQFYLDTALGGGIGCYKPEVVELEERFKDHYFSGDSGLLIRAYASPEEFTYWDSRIRKTEGD